MLRTHRSFARLALRSALLVPVAACGGDGLTGPGGGRLTPGESRVLSGRAGSQRLFTIAVPEGTGMLRVQLRDGDGDADLVLRRGAPPETGMYDCASEAAGPLEECLVDAPAAGTWYVLVVGHDAYAGVRLNGSLLATGGASLLTPGAPLAGLSGGAGSLRLFAVDVPAGAQLTVQVAAASGDVDLFVRKGAYPLLHTFDCASWTPSGTESCQRWSPTADRWYIRLEGFTPYSGATLTATVTAPPPAIAAPQAR